jgi:hypothetical protein
MGTFESMEALEAHFSALKSQAKDDPEKLAKLTIERAEAVAEFRLQQIAAKEQAAWKSAALAKYPLAAQFPELVTGSTEAEIEASAKSVQERLEKVKGEQRQQEQSLQQQAQQAYGGASSGGGTATTWAPETERFMMDFADRFNNGRRVTMNEVSRYVRERLTSEVVPKLRVVQR